MLARSVQRLSVQTRGGTLFGGRARAINYSTTTFCSYINRNTTVSNDIVFSNTRYIPIA